MCAAATATWACLNASCYGALSMSTPLLFVAGSPQSSTLQLATTASASSPCFYSCCSIPIAGAVPPAARAPFQSAWTLPDPMLPLGVLAVVPPSTNGDSVPQAVVSIAPSVPPVHQLTQFAIAFGIAGQGPGASAPILPDGASVTVVVETQLATGGGNNSQEFTVSTITPNNPDWTVALGDPPADPTTPPDLTVTMVQSSMAALTTLPFLFCQLTDATRVFTGRFAIIWYANTPTLPYGTTAFTLGLQWAAFAGMDQILLPVALRAFPAQLPATKCSVLQTVAGSLTCSGSTAIASAPSLSHRSNTVMSRPSRHLPQSHFGAGSTSTSDIALLSAASVLVAVVCVIFIVFVPRFILRLKRK